MLIEDIVAKGHIEVKLQGLLIATLKIANANDLMIAKVTNNEW